MLLKDIEKEFVVSLVLLYGEREALNIFNEVVGVKIGWSKAQIAQQQNIQLSADIIAYLKHVLEELKQSKPVQYVLGQAYFYDNVFEVNKDVLIPRPETEELVHWIINTPNIQSGKGLDIGTGTGCIPITLDLNMSGLKMSAIDVSQAAINVANRNNQKLNASVDFVCMDVFDSVILDAFNDLSFVVSNPPYITEKERVVMLDNVLKYEPELALFAPGDALGFYRQIASVGQVVLSKGAPLFFECNEFNAQNVVDILRSNAYENIEIKQDLQGKDRMVRAFKV